MTRPWRFDGDGVERDGCVASLTSSDLNNWTLTGQYYSSSYFTGSYECPDHFKMGDWYYLVFSNCSYGKQTYYVKSQSPNGPWQIPLNDTFDSRFFYAAKTVSDGDNRYIIGWAGDRDGEVTIPDTDVNVENTDDLAMIGYAGNMVVHQLEQTEDGDLIAVPAQCITSQFTAPMANTLTPKTGSWQKGADYAKVTADNSCATLLMQDMPEQFMLTFKLKTTAKQAGIVLNTDSKFAYNGYYLIFDRLYSRLRESTGTLAGTYGYYFPYDSELERPLTFVQGKTYDVTVLCEGQIAVIYVDGECALTVRMTQEDRGKLGLFCYAGSAEFTDIQMYSYERDELADRLLAAYSFDTQTTQDDIGNNDATFYNNATAGTGVYTDGVSGKALQLSTKGTSQKYWLSVPYAAFADSRDSFTLSMWYKATDRNTSGEDSELFSLYNSSAEKFLFYAPALTGNANMGYSMKWDSTYGYVNVPYAQRVNEWTNLVYVVSDSGGQTQISVYINGTQISVDRGGAWANSLMSQLGIDTFTIGGKNPYKGGATPSCLFYGAVDEIKLYAGALTATEVSALYGEGHLHSYTEQIVPPTCTAQGYTLHFCSCGHSFKDNYTAIVEHNYIPGTIVAPSCASEGYTVNTCSGCGDVIHTNVTSALEHSYAAPVDTDSNVHTFTCLVCGQTFTEAHDYENGVCICGREQLKIASAYLRLDQDIDVIYTAEIPTNAVDPYMTFTLCDTVYTVRDYTVNSNGQYCFEFCGLRPQLMNENICAVLHATVNSAEETDTLAQYSVREYCENTLARYSQNENLVTLLSDLLTYGAAAQTYVGYKTDALVTSGLDLTPSTFTSAEGIAISFAGERDDAADWTSAALALSNDLAMRFAFTAESVDGLSVEVSINGRTETFTEFETAGEGKYVVVYATPAAPKNPVDAAPGDGVLMAEYNFNYEHTKDSIGDNDATFYDNATAGTGEYVDGVAGKGLRLSEQGTAEKFWLSVPIEAFGDNRDNISISLWYKADGFNAAGEDSELFSLYNSKAERFIFYSPAAVAFQDKGFTMKWDGSYGYANVISPYQAGKWTHLVYVINGKDNQSVIRAYVNGKAVEVDQGGAWANSLLSQLGIDTFTIGGKNPNKGGDPPACLFYGAIDEVKLFAGTLTQVDAQRLYEEPKDYVFVPEETEDPEETEPAEETTETFTETEGQKPDEPADSAETKGMASALKTGLILTGSTAAVSIGGVIAALLLKKKRKGK